MIEIARAESDRQFEQVRELMTAFAEWDRAQTEALGLDGQAMLDFYYGAKDDTLPGRYAPPEGCLLLATVEGRAAGSIAFRRVTPETCEMTRLFVSPEFRGMRVGSQMAERLIETALGAGYRVMRLETTTFMKNAVALYGSLGFVKCEPYYEIPESFRAVTLFMKLELYRPSM